MRKGLLFNLLPLLALLVSCGGDGSKEEHARYVRCDTVKLAESSVTQSRFSGRVKAAAEANVAFRVAGQIAKMSVTQGQFVRKGTVIAQLDQNDYRTQLTATEAEYNSIKSEVDRVIELYEKKSVTPNEYDKAVYGLKQITAKLEAHRNTLSYTCLIAPFDGYVQKKLFDIGETVAAGMAVISLISTDSPEIEINIPTADFIRRGDYISAKATIDGFSNRLFDLELVGIGRKANLNQLYATTFRIKEGAQVAPGMTAMVTIYYRTEGVSSMRIPVTALSGDSVWLLKDGKSVRKEVKVLEIKNNGNALVEGLADGDLVISSGINNLKEGQAVKALPAKSATNVGGML